MKIQTMPKETLAELLLFLAEREEFSTVQELLSEGVPIAEVRAALRELAMEVRKEAQLENESDYNPQKDAKLSKEAKTIISYLSPGEEKTLLKAFGLIEKIRTIRPPQ